MHFYSRFFPKRAVSNWAYVLGTQDMNGMA
jgi:hypothetical protein